MHALVSVVVVVVVHTSNISETAGPINVKLHVEHPYDRGKKIYINGTGNMTKMATSAIKSKTFKNLQNQKAWDPETWHVALGSQALSMVSKLYNHGPRMTLTYFTERST